MVDRVRAGQALQAVLLGLVRNHPVQGNGVFVIHPKDVLFIEISAQRGYEPARRCSALLRSNIRDLPVTDTGRIVITPCEAYQDGGGAAESSMGVEYKDFGVRFVYDRERHSAIVSRVCDPINKPPCILGLMLSFEVRIFGVSVLRNGSRAGDETNGHKDKANRFYSGQARTPYRLCAPERGQKAQPDLFYRFQ